MLLQLRRKDLLRLVQGRGATLCVVSGQVWITEEGCADDRFLGPGGRYRIAGDGLVLIGAASPGGDGPAAEIALRVTESGSRTGPLSSRGDAAIGAGQSAFSR